ncbi:MAG: hypothetical protein SPI97_03685 [Oscillospiraceae bacterium]|nr:hypothetical protein [Oscillospiraceae bacterium]
MNTREERFEAMLRDILNQYDSTVRKMDSLKAEGKNKSVTFRQLLGSKLTLQNILAIYKTYGLIDENGNFPSD